MSLKTFGGYTELSRFPRVSGDEPFSRAFKGLAKEFSPRERG